MKPSTQRAQRAGMALTVLTLLIASVANVPESPIWIIGLMLLSQAAAILIFLRGTSHEQ